MAQFGTVAPLETRSVCRVQLLSSNLVRMAPSIGMNTIVSTIGEMITIVVVVKVVMTTVVVVAMMKVVMITVVAMVVDRITNME